MKDGMLHLKFERPNAFVNAIEIVPAIRAACGPFECLPAILPTVIAKDGSGGLTATPSAAERSYTKTNSPGHRNRSYIRPSASVISAIRFQSRRAAIP